MKNKLIPILVVLAVILAVVAKSAFFIVPEWKQALVLQFGNPKREVTEPGLYLKLPIMNNVVFYDKRVLNLDPPGQELLLSDQLRINLDAYARYRITNPLLYKQTADTEANFERIFGKQLNTEVRNSVARVTLGELLGDKRDDVMTEITNSMKERAPRFGVELVDVRIGRTDLPEQTSNSVYSRMRSAREAEAKQLRAEGQEQKDTIEAEANRRRTVLLAKAKETSLKLRGEGDASKISILAAAHNRDPKFYSFLKSLEAYKASLKEGTTLVLKPDSEFFKYLKQIPKP